MENLPVEQDQDEIIIKCSLEEMAKAFFKDYEIIWHDPNVNSEENQQYMTQLEKLCRVQTFTEWKEAENYIKTAKTICHVITSGTNGELLVKEIFSSQNVPKILTFCRDEDYHSAWAKNYHQKILCTATKIEDVISQIQKNLLEWQKQTSSLKFDLPAFAPVFNDSDKSQMNHLHHYLKVIPNFHNRTQAKKDFVDISKRVYSDQKNEKFIALFEQGYNHYEMENTLRWYTQPSFLFKVINNCLRIATSDSIQWSRFFLKDLERAIKDQYRTRSKNFNGLLYRAAYLSEEEWSSLKGNVNREIEMHGFLSVSKDKSAALKFMGVDPAQKVFITIIVPKGPIEEEQGFAEVEEFSKFPKEQEVLFNVRSRFTVLETEDEYSEKFPSRHLVLLYGAQSLRKYIGEKDPFKLLLTEDIRKVFCSRCQLPTDKMPEELLFISLKYFEKPSYSCQKCIVDDASPPFLCIPIIGAVQAILLKGCLLTTSSQTQIPFYGYKCSKCGAKRQNRYFVCSDCGERDKIWCQRCFDKTLNCIETDHNIILENSPFSYWCEKMSENELNHWKFQNSLVAKSDNVFQQVQMYFETHEYEKAIEYCNLYISKNEAKSKDEELATSYHHIGAAYNYQAEYDKALEHYFKSLEILESASEKNYDGISNCENDIGLVYTHQGKYDKALEHHSTSLKMRKLVSGEDDPDVAASYSNIAFLYDKQGEPEKALGYHLKSLDIYKSLYGENHPSTATVYNNIALEHYKQKEYDKALGYNLKALDIYKSLHGEKHPDVATSYNQIALIHSKHEEYKEALEYYLKSLEISKSIYGENHPNVATVYTNMGSLYHQQEDHSMALEYYLMSMDMLKSLYGEDHLSVATPCSNIGYMYGKQGEYKKALDYHLKALDIFKSFHGENHHPDVAASYHSIAMIYYELEEFNEALIYSLKYLDMFKSAKGEKHSEVALICSKIGLAYYSQGEFKEAIEYYLRSLEIYKSIEGEDSSDVGFTCQNIGMIYDTQEKYQEALEYYMKALEVLDSVFEGNNPFKSGLQDKLMRISCFLPENQVDYSSEFEDPGELEDH